ncbi:hypothetical protein K443DRAFT_129821 [Laccaria amethystina LaAM-08-1]|uniref:Uncharacterized protein n=1 Tax=Laccaria amethystina LaAM-08-1 TaxID=1095629 RepID=A0A0C9Y8M2_9AGAR|nr:hypothetical protein K443DRAFT_129821 [Laccaria amethystina LaAM-08-1]
MTEYDYSPEAYERYLATQNRIARWVDGTLTAIPRNPFTPATPAGQPLVFQREPDDHDDDERRPPGIHVILPALLRLLAHVLRLLLPIFHKINFHGINTHPLLLGHPNHTALTPTPPNHSTIHMRWINISITPTQINQSSFLSTLTVGATHSIDPLISQMHHSSHIRHIRHNHLQNSLCWLGSFRVLQVNTGPRDGNAVAVSNNLRPCSTSR